MHVLNELVIVQVDRQAADPGLRASQMASAGPPPSLAQATVAAAHQERWSLPDAEPFSKSWWGFESDLGGNKGDCLLPATLPGGEPCLPARRGLLIPPRSQINLSPCQSTAGGGLVLTGRRQGDFLRGVAQHLLPTPW